MVDYAGAIKRNLASPVDDVDAQAIANLCEGRVGFRTLDGLFVCSGAQSGVLRFTAPSG